MQHGPGHVEHGVSLAGLVLESLREGSATDVVQDGPEALGHGLAVHLEGTGQAAEDGRGPVLLRGAEEARFPERLEDHFHLARHVHLHHQRLGGDPRFAADVEGDHDRHAEESSHRLLHEEIEGGLHGRAHLDGPRAQDAQRVGQAQHPLLRAFAAVRFHAHAGPEALPREVSRAGRGPGHAGGDEENVDAVRWADEPEAQAIAGAKGDRAAGPERGSDLAREDLGNDLVGEEHEDDVVRGGHGDGRHLEPLGARPGRVLVLAVADLDLDAGVAEVEGGAPPQITVADHGHRLAGQRPLGRVGRPVHLHGSLWHLSLWVVLH